MKFKINRKNSEIYYRKSNKIYFFINKKDQTRIYEHVLSKVIYQS